MNIDIGVTKQDRKAAADGLSRLLADSYTLYLKTHNYHWNVTGPLFNTLHVMFEQQYTELAVAVDDVAERIRALGFPAPGSYQAFSGLTAIEEDQDVQSATDMIRHLLGAHETVARTAHEVHQIISDANDEVTADLLTQRMQIHEKTAWMLRSMLEND